MKQIKSSAINATIAEILEPHSKLPSAEYWDCMTPSHGGAWKIEQYGYVPFETKAKQRWQPLDFLHDPRGTVMLQNEILIHHDLRMDRGGSPAFTVEVFDGKHWAVTDADSLEEAVAHAFLRANGYEVSE